MPCARFARSRLCLGPSPRPTLAREAGQHVLGHVVLSVSTSTTLRVDPACRIYGPASRRPLRERQPSRALLVRVTLPMRMPSAGLPSGLIRVRVGRPLAAVPGVPHDLDSDRDLPGSSRLVTSGAWRDHARLSPILLWAANLTRADCGTRGVRRLAPLTLQVWGPGVGVACAVIHAPPAGECAIREVPPFRCHRAWHLRPARARGPGPPLRLAGRHAGPRPPHGRVPVAHPPSGLPLTPACALAAARSSDPSAFS